ncbi:hypothetical protein Pint_07829 [Pistacia integerrima]|uniref:Uncharacterized protein n=1 Tax=Pistacia integerrima TaxID=434235 RepID=A0ACC0XRN0_9ROSI|nr:hypothetical protein Pint_07829 [Pistacia integerrima]
MDFTSINSVDTNWWVFTLPAIVETQNLFNSWLLISVFIAFLCVGLLTWAVSTGGLAWKNGRNQMGSVPILGPRGLPLFGCLFSLSCGLAHRTLASMASSFRAKQLMALSLGSTPVVVTSDPIIAREILTSPHFANRPIKHSAKSLMFSRAIGFAPNGSYWRLLRRIASSHLFAPKRIAAHESGRQMDCVAMLRAIAEEQSLNGVVYLRKHLQAAALNNITGTVFGKRYDMERLRDEAKELHEIVREGFEILGAFNWSDYLPWLKCFYDPFRINERCSVLVPRIRKLVKQIIREHQLKDEKELLDDSAFVDWVMAELILNPDVQVKVHQELDLIVGNKIDLTDVGVAKLKYLQAVIKETLRIHPPGPLLSWARLSTSDVHLSNGMVVPANTTAMVNMWAITHDPTVWEEPLAFKPERYLKSQGGADVDVRGVDLRLAPFGAGRRVCPGKNLGLVTVSLWVAKLLHRFEWVQDISNPVDLSEVLNLSCEMKNPLRAVAVPRNA